MMNEAVNHGSDHLVIGKDPTPLGELQIRRQYQTFALIAVRYHAKQQLRTVLIHRHIVPFIKDEQIQTAQVPKKPF